VGGKNLLEKKPAIFNLLDLQDGKTRASTFLQMLDIGTTHMREVPKVPGNG